MIPILTLESRLNANSIYCRYLDLCYPKPFICEQHE